MSAKTKTNELHLACICDEAIPRQEFSWLVFERVGRLIHVYFNGVKINVLTVDELSGLIIGLERLAP